MVGNSQGQIRGHLNLQYLFFFVWCGLIVRYTVCEALMNIIKSALVSHFLWFWLSIAHTYREGFQQP